MWLYNLLSLSSFYFVNIYMTSFLRDLIVVFDNIKAVELRAVGVRLVLRVIWRLG